MSLPNHIKGLKVSFKWNGRWTSLNLECWISLRTSVDAIIFWENPSNCPGRPRIKVVWESRGCKNIKKRAGNIWIYNLVLHKARVRLLPPLLTSYRMLHSKTVSRKNLELYHKWRKASINSVGNSGFKKQVIYFTLLSCTPIWWTVIFFLLAIIFLETLLLLNTIVVYILVFLNINLFIVTVFI